MKRSAIPKDGTNCELVLALCPDMGTHECLECWRDSSALSDASVGNRRWARAETWM